jgi:hypothetical protein
LLAKLFYSLAGAEHLLGTARGRSHAWAGGEPTNGAAITQVLPMSFMMHHRPMQLGHAREDQL